MKFGRKTISYHGCAAVATYNALSQNDRKKPMSEVVHELELSGAVGGENGTSALLFGAGLKRLNIRWNRFMSIKKAEKIRKQCGEMIIFIGKEKNPLKGHVVYVQAQRDGDICIWNSYNYSTGKNYRDSVSESFGKKKIQMGYEII